MTDGALNVYVLCSSRSTANEWTERAEQYAGLRIDAVFPVTSPVGTIRDLAQDATFPFVVCREDVWFGLDLAAHVSRLCDDLKEQWPTWGLCGNCGVRWDGTHVYNYTYDLDRGGLQTSVGIHPVISIDDNVLLINPEAIREHRKQAPRIESSNFGIPLSLECLLNGSALLVSPRLMTMRSNRHQLAATMALRSDRDFSAFYNANFVNHSLPTPDGPLDLSETVEYSYLLPQLHGIQQRDLLQLYDNAVETARPAWRPSLTICCRTQFRRNEMLARAVLSFAAFRQYAAEYGHVNLQLITDQPEELVHDHLTRLREAYPCANLDCWFHRVRPGRYSRTDLLIAGLERATTDYVWFIDDDDFANSAAAPGLLRCLEGANRAVVIGGSAVIKETWTTAPDNRLELERSDFLARYGAAGVLRVLRGSNHVPVCSMLFPVALMKERLRSIKALGNYNEDYFLLMLALTSPRVEVLTFDTDIASISIRGDENTVAQKDRGGWLVSYATFIAELLNNPEGNSPYLWQIGNSKQI